MPRLLLLLAFTALLTACAGTQDGAWVMRPEGGGPTLAEHLSEEFERDPVGTAHAIGQLIGHIALIVLLLVRGP
jgi:hypothetical protein